MSTAMEIRADVLSAMLAPRGDHYGEHMKHFTRYVDGRPVDFEIVHDYFRDLNATTYSANTRRLKRQAVKARLRLALDSVDFNRAAQLKHALDRLDHDAETKAPRVQATPIGADRVISRDSLDRMLAAASARDALLLRFLWQTGCRVSELTGALLSRCESKGSTVHIPVRGKGDKERTLRIRTTLFEAIRGEFHGQTFLFETAGGKAFSRCYISTRIHRLAMEVLGRKLGAHSLRHSWATRKVRQGKDLSAISRYLGHQSTAITSQFYVHTSLSDDELFDPEDGG